MATYIIFCDQRISNSHTQNYKILYGFIYIFVTSSFLGLFLYEQMIANVMKNIYAQIVLEMSKFRHSFS
ncbi:hypothetical protein HanXRQr2_Chr04g0181531 [Helianthus annuus]|uniref:Uncharacterized protein n=1 Tax=Helianthus annuus TaxID=4232 RepID=A0A9K3J9X6_HELAN|nr:hypothetical protein HanXRQr2_Chr04g0181531 [Helianthus annuus]